MRKLNQEELWAVLDDLLKGRGFDAGEDLPGAELVVTDNDREVFRAALARHARRDADDPSVIWIRPLVMPGGTRMKLPAFDLAIVRRRALHVAAAQLDEDCLELGLVTGQRARIRPARGARLAVLQDFDTWMTTFTAERRSAVEALDCD
jgi:hypothetical protein